MRIRHIHGAAALVHEGETFTPDDDGYIDAPFELAQILLSQPAWETEVAEVYVPEPESVITSDAAEEPELTPYQKGLLTRAANEAAKAAQAK